MAVADPTEVQEASSPSGTLAAATPPLQLPHIHISPSGGWVRLRLGEVWEYRELLYFLIWRDVKVRYKQTALGASWAIIQPFMTMVAFTLFFGNLAKIPSDGVPYPIFSYAALLPWTFFANAMGQASTSLVTNSNLISKVFFPRLVIPTASVVGGLVDFVIAFVVLLGMMVFYHVAPTPAIILLPIFLLLSVIIALAVGLWLSALNVKYRDVKYVVPFLTQFWLFATPVAYPSSLLSEPWRTIYGLNPMVGVVDGFRWALLGTTPPGPMILLSTVVALVLLVTGAYYFRLQERTFADVV